MTFTQLIKFINKTDLKPNQLFIASHSIPQLRPFSHICCLQITYAKVTPSYHHPKLFLQIGQSFSNTHKDNYI